MRAARCTAFTLKQHVRKWQIRRIKGRILTPLLTADPLSLISAIHGRKMRAGVAISPDTPSTAITDEIGNAVDMLLVMTVYPGSSRVRLGNLSGSCTFHTGRGGQKFLERCVPKVAELRRRFPEKDIEVDGGVGPKTVDVCAQAGEPVLVICGWVFLDRIAGSNVIVAGTAIFGAENPEHVIATLKGAVDTALARVIDH